MRRAIPVLLVLGVILYLLWGARESTPTKLLTQQDPASAPQTKKKVSTPIQRVSSQNMQGATGTDFEDDPVGTLSVDGVVLDEEGEGLEGALVGISSSPSRQTVSGKGGVFSFDKLVGRTYYFEANKGELRGSATLVLNEDSLPVTIRTEKGSTAEVTVLDELDRRPIPNAEVSWGWMTELTATTNEEGKAVMQGLDRWVWFSVRAEGYNPSSSDIQPSTVTGSISKSTVLMQRGAQASGVVLDPDGNPVENALVEAEGDRGGVFNDDFHKIRTDAQGRWMIPAVASGSYRFSAASDTFAKGYSEPTTLDGKTPTEGIIIRLEPGGVLTGKVVTSSGAPVVGAVVRAVKDESGWGQGSRRAYSDTDGKFTIKGLPRAPLVVAATSMDSNQANPVKADLTSGSAEATLTIDIAGTIAGIVVDLQGNPIADATVSAFPLNYMKDQDKWRFLQPRSTNSDPDGRFEMKGVVADEEFSIQAEFPGMSFGASWRDKDSQIIAKAGARDVKLVLKSLSVVTGKVQFADGTVPKEFSVSVGYESKGDFTDADGGSFVLEKVSPGKQTATVEGKSFIYKRSKQFELKPGETTDIGTLIVDAGRVVQGRVLLDGQPVENATVIVAGYVGGSGSRLEEEKDYNKKNRTLTDAEGAFTLKGLEPDEELTAIAEHPTKGRSQPIKIEKNSGDATLELTLLPGGAVEGVVTRAGKPYPGRIQSSALERTRAGFSTNVGVDGKFRFDFLTAGTYELTAFGEWSMSKNPGTKTARVTVEVGKTKRVNIDLPPGITLALNPTRDGKTLERVSLSLVKQSISPKNTEELEAATRNLPQDQVLRGYTFSIPGSSASPMSFVDVPPGSYTLCMSQSPEEEIYDNMTDEERKAPRPVFCQPQTIADAPAEQTIAVELPAGY